MVLSGVPRKKSPVTPPGTDPGTIRLAAQCLNHYATPGPENNGKFAFIINATKVLKFGTVALQNGVMIRRLEAMLL